jgi:biopolymer transport protein ExbB
LGILAVVLTFFKLIEVARFRVPARAEINQILDELLGGKPDEAVSMAKGLPGLAGQVVVAGAKYFFCKRRVLEDALYEKLSAVQPRLERFLPFLAVIAAAAPMAGLLGTVLGIMKTFEMMAAFGTGDAKVTAGGIGEALITTFLGLMVAIPTIIVHGALKSLARTRLGQVEGLALAMSNGTTEIVSGGGLPVEKAKASAQPDDEDDDLEDLVAEPAT